MYLEYDIRYELRAEGGCLPPNTKSKMLQYSIYLIYRILRQIKPLRSYLQPMQCSLKEERPQQQLA